MPAAKVPNDAWDWLSSAKNRNGKLPCSKPKPPNWAKRRKELIIELESQHRDLVRENALLLLGMGLLYMDFVDACRNGMSGRIEQCIRCFAIIYQGTVATKYAAEMLHMVACLQKYWKKEFKVKHVMRVEVDWPDPGVPSGRTRYLLRSKSRRTATAIRTRPGGTPAQWTCV